MVIARERPDALLPTLGGQTALNTAVALHEAGVLDKYGVELIGAEHRRDPPRRGPAAVQGDRGQGRVAAGRPATGAALAGLPLDGRGPRDRRRAGPAGGDPAVVHHGRPRLRHGAHAARSWSGSPAPAWPPRPVHEVLIEESVLGWKEYELELMRDRHDNVVVVCSIENIDPMGVHTGDSVTVAPGDDADRPGVPAAARPRHRRAARGRRGHRRLQHPVRGATRPTGRLVVIEMNPRVSRSSALASKATGFPIAKIAAKLAIGYTLDEIPNDITCKTPAAFEPALDYVVVKIPRFAFEKFPGADPELTTTMKSVGEAMSLGRNFTEALNKAMRSMETKAAGFWTAPDPAGADDGATLEALRIAARRPALHRRAGAAARRDASPRCTRPAAASTRGSSTRSPRWSSCAPRSSTRRCSTRRCCAGPSGPGCPTGSSPRCARSWPARTGCARCGTGSACGRSTRRSTPARPSSPPTTPYHYSTYDEETEVAPSDRPKVLILGSGPNRIGQGIEFDYSCVHAVMALREAGFETVMVNCNPETVSTDYDTADRLYFEPLTFEDVLEVCHAEDTSGQAAGGPGVVGVIVQLGGQTPLGLAQRLKDAGRADRRHLARVDPPGRGPRRVRRGAGRGRAARARRTARPPRSTRRRRSPTRSATRCWSGRPTCSAGAAWRSSTTTPTLRDYIGRATDISPGPPGAGGPVPRRRDRDRRRRALRRRPARSTSAA